MGNYSNLFVCLMGIGIVFLGLACLVLLTRLLSAACHTNRAPQALPFPPPSTLPQSKEAICDEWVAAVSAAIAEELGTDITEIRILSIKALKM